MRKYITAWLAVTALFLGGMGALRLSAGLLNIRPILIFSSLFQNKNKIADNGCSGDNPVAGGNQGDPVACQASNTPTQIIDGYLIALEWTKGNSSGGIDLGYESNTVPGQYDFAKLYSNNSLGFYLAQNCKTSVSSHPCYIAISSGLTGAGGTTPMAPGYTADDFANGTILTGANNWPDQAANLNPWNTTTKFVVTETVSFGGQYWTLGGTVPCQPTGIVGPSADGCPWTGPQAHAPAQDFATCTGTTYNFPTGMPAQGVFNIDNTATACGGIQCTEAQLTGSIVNGLQTPVWMAHVIAFKAFELDQKNNHPTAYAADKYNRIAMWKVGETNPNVCEAQFEAQYGLTQDQFYNNVTTKYDRQVGIFQAYQASIGYNVIQDVSFSIGVNSWADAQAALGPKYGVGIGMQGLRAGTGNASTGVPAQDYASYLTGGNGTGDWISNFKAYCAGLPECHIQEQAASFYDSSQTGDGRVMYPLSALFCNAQQFCSWEGWWQEFVCAADTGGSAPANGNCPTPGPAGTSGPTASPIPLQSYFTVLQQAGKYGIPAPLSAGVSRGN